MASPAALLPDLTTRESTIPSTQVARNLVPNEDAVVSESSLSPNSSHSIRSTPASSFSNHQTSPNNERRLSNLQPVEEIELSSPSDSTRPDVVSSQEGSCPSSSLGSTLTEQQVEARSTSSSLHQQRLDVSSFQKLLRTIYQYVPTSNIIGLVAVFLTAFFGYEQYKYAKIAAELQQQQMCMDEAV
jgi:hypothetical protein